jgi:hypothetical protein
MSAKFKMHGMQELKRKLASLDRKLQRSISGKVLRAGAKITVRALRADAPKASGRGSKAIGTKIKTYKGTRITAAISGERMTSRRGREKTSKSKWGGPHFHLIEYGTGKRFHTGEKAAREFAAVTSARAKAGKQDSAAYVSAVLAKTGSFGRSNPAKFSRNLNLRFATTLRDVQERVKKGQRLKRYQKAIAKDLRTGKSTGRVNARPFFKKAWERVRPAVLNEQARVLGREIEAAARVA